MIFVIYGILALAFFRSHINVKELSCPTATPYIPIVHSVMDYMLQYFVLNICNYLTKYVVIFFCWVVFSARVHLDKVHFESI